MDHPRAHSRAWIACAATIVLASALVTAAAPAGASPAHRTHARKRHVVAAAPRTVAPAGTTNSPAGAQGLVVATDPVNGGLRMPSKDEMLELTPTEKTGLMRSTDGLTPVRMANGALMLDLQGRFQEFSVLRLDGNGKPRIVCVEDPRTVGANQVSRAPAPVHEVK